MRRSDDPRKPCGEVARSTKPVGLVVTTAYTSSAVLTALWGYWSDRYGRKNILMLLAALTIVSNVIYIFFIHLIFIISALVIANVGAAARAPADKAAVR